MGIDYRWRGEWMGSDGRSILPPAASLLPCTESHLARDAVRGKKDADPGQVPPLITPVDSLPYFVFVGHGPAGPPCLFFRQSI